MKEKVMIVVVTYNRKKMLKECIEACLNQTYKDFTLLIVDNNSTDGTYEEVVKKYENKQVKYINTNKNIGGAGGFNLGIKEAILQEYDFAWVMDDDSIPEPNALESIIKKKKILKNEFSFICSLVKWTDNTYCKMNGVVFYHNGIMEQYDKIYENLLVAECCSFVGCFINLKIASDIGLPIKEFFIYADDHEYTNRLSEVKKGYLDAESIIIHKMKENSIPEVYDVSEDRINRYFYNFRNVTFIYMRKSIIKGFFNSFIRWARTIKYILKYSKSKKLKRIFVITKGTFCGIFFRPKIEFVNKNEK